MTEQEKKEKNECIKSIKNVLNGLLICAQKLNKEIPLNTLTMTNPPDNNKDVEN